MLHKNIIHVTNFHTSFPTFSNPDVCVAKVIIDPNDFSKMAHTVPVYFPHAGLAHLLWLTDPQYFRK